MNLRKNGLYLFLTALIFSFFMGRANAATLADIREELARYQTEPAARAAQA